MSRCHPPCTLRRSSPAIAPLHTRVYQGFSEIARFHRSGGAWLLRGFIDQNFDARVLFVDNTCCLSLLFARCCICAFSAMEIEIQANV